MEKKPNEDVSIGKFDILATYTYAKGLLNGLGDDEAKERGMVAAIMGAQARLGHPLTLDEYKSVKDAAEKKKMTTITAGSFDRQVARKMGEFFGAEFFPAMRDLAEAGLSYEDVKRLVKIPSTWGAKISGEQFKERASKPTPKLGGKEARGKKS